MFIDSGQKLVHDVQTSSSLAHVVGDFAARLKLFAEEEDLIVWLIWHLKKDDDVTLVQLSASYLRDSGRLYQECDGLVFLYRDVKSNGISKIQENWLKIFSTRRSGAFEELIPIVKRGEYFKELDVEDV